MNHPVGYKKSALYHLVIGLMYIPAVWYHISAAWNHMKDKM